MASTTFHSVMPPGWLEEELSRIGGIEFDPLKSLTLGFPKMAEVPSHFDMLSMRMRWNQYSKNRTPGAFTPTSPFDDVHVHANEKEAIVFVVVKGEPTIIRDGIELFPSDTLVTQLKMLGAV